MSVEQRASAVTRFREAVARAINPASFTSDKVQNKPPKGEIAWSGDSFFARAGAPFESYNRDELVWRKGPHIYDRMMRDDQVKAAFNFVLDTIASRSWRFELPDVEDSELEKQKEIQKFLTWNMKKFLRGTIEQLFKNVLNSKKTGYSVNEMVFVATEFEGNLRWAVKAVKLKPFWTFTFRHDEFGNIIDLKQRQGVGDGTKLDPRKFILHITNPTMDPIFGESDLRSAYRAFWAKENILKFMNIYLERMAGGFIWAKVDGALSPKEKNDMRDILSRMSSSTGLMVPSTVDLNVEMPASTEAFENAISVYDLQIARSLLMPNLLGLTSPNRTGAFAQSKTQQEGFLIVMGLQGDDLADTMNEQLFRPLAFWNFGVDNFPRLVFDPFTEEQKRAVVTAWNEAVNKGTVTNLPQDEERTRELLCYDPLPEEIKDRLEKESLETETETETEPDPPSNPDGEPEEKLIDQDVENSTAEMVQLGRLDRDLNPPTGPRPIQTRNNFPWRERADFAQTGRIFDSTARVMARSMDIAITKAFDAVVASMVEAGPNEGPANADFEQVLQKIDVSIPPSVNRELNRAIRQGLGTMYDTGRQTGIDEVNRAAGELDQSQGDRIRMAAKLSRKRAVKPKIKNWTPWNFAQGIDLTTAEGYLDARAFELSGDLTDEVKSNAKQIIIDGIKSERTIKTMVGELELLLKPLLGGVDDQGRKINIGARLETIVRTNLTDAFNQSRLAVFTDPDMGGFVEALEYSAILDSRTTDFCRGADGKIYAIDDPFWNFATPPNHFNCRSIQIPVTAVDTWTQSQPLPDTLRPATGFGITGDQ